jgi:hypothetical protein
MNPNYILWATPRSTSTAFEWMMRMRGDMACSRDAVLSGYRVYCGCSPSTMMRCITLR